jgi:hypothetical protein
VIKRENSWRRTKEQIVDRVLNRKPGLRAWLFLAYHLRKVVGYDFPLTPEDKKILNDAAREIGWRAEDQKPYEGEKGFSGAMGHEIKGRVLCREDEALSDTEGTD